MAGEPLIKVRNLTVRFGTKTILDEVNVDINKNDIFGIVGLSGSGKTTLLNTIIGSLEPVSGEVFYKIEPEIKKKRKKKGKKSIDELKPKAELKPVLKNLMRVRQVFGFAAQEPSFYPELTVVENLRYFSAMYNIPKETYDKNIDILLELVGLVHSKSLTADKLSGGMQKRLDIACSLVHNPKVLILDEPTADLDPILRRSMWNMINKINAKGTTIVVASHFLRDISTFCSRIGIIHNQKMMKVGTPEEIRDLYTKDEEIHLETHPGDYDAIIRALKKIKGFKISKITNKGHELVIYTPDSIKVLHNLLHIIDKKKEHLIDVDVNKPTLREVFESFVKEDNKEKGNEKENSEIKTKK